MLSGNSGTAAEGLFAVDSESGFLLVTRVLDREEQAEYRLQVGRVGPGVGESSEGKAGH